MNSCQAALVSPVNMKLMPIKNPITVKTILGPYISIAQPPVKAKMQLKAMRQDRIAEVVARVSPKALSKDLKKTPKEEVTPIMMKLLTIIASTTIQP